MSPVFQPVLRNSPMLSSGIAPLSQCGSSARIRRVVVQGHSLAHNPVLHPVRNGGQSPSVARPAEVADDSIASSVCLKDRHVFAREALRLTGCVGIHSVGVRALKGG
jgi:hypothetical protein